MSTPQLEELKTLTNRVMSPDLLEQVFEHGHDAALIVGPRGTIVAFNRAAGFMFGLTKDQAIGQPLEILLPPRLRETHANHRTGFGRAPRPRAMGATQELIGQRSDGDEFRVEIGLTPIQMADGLYTSAIIRKPSNG
jgi:PAS domain S-box-containing protein